MSNRQVTGDNSSLSRYLYKDVRSENRTLWTTMFTVLGLFFLALGFVLGGDEKSKIVDYFGSVYIPISQLIWLFAMLEILLFSNYNSKRKYLTEMEKMFAQSPAKANHRQNEHLWELWLSKYRFVNTSGYIIAIWSIILWSFFAFIWVAYKSIGKALISEPMDSYFLGALYIFQILVAGIACCQTYRQHRDANKSGKGEVSDIDNDTEQGK